MISLPAGTTLILASGSPRRARLLSQVGLEFDVIAPDIDETPAESESPRDYVARLATQKALTVHRRGTLVVAADTTVAIDGHILEKPLDDDDARRMLTMLSGRSHDVHTGVCVIGADRPSTQVVTTVVTFDRLSPDAIDWYIATGEPNGKAGAYAIQDLGAALVAGVAGSVTNVVGLPLVETLAMLRAAV